MALNFTKLNNWLFDLIFPQFCVVCSSYGDFLCKKCLGQLPQEPKYISSTILYKKKRVPKIFANHIKGVWYFWDYRDVRVKKVIHSYKFGLIKGLADLVSPFLNSFLIKIKKLIGAEIVLIPPDARRERSRGFDHISEIIDKNLVSLNVRIYRVKKVDPQTTMRTKDERWQNLKNSFEAKILNKIPSHTPIILIDDILTSGATACSVAKSLAKLGYKKIFLLVLAMQEF